ncbi:MAG: hypothetical protein ACKVRO_18165 [Micropepsaceae bacterium]
MPWTIPDKGEGDNDLQSILFQEHLEVLVEGISGKNCVLSGCAVTGGADMTPEVAKGAVLSNGTLFAVAASTVTIGAADPTNPRIDLVVVNASGALAVRPGTAAAAPKPPARTANDVVLAAVYVPANDTSIETSKITDMRILREQGPIVIHRDSASKTQANSAAAVSIFNAAPSMPSGLFLAGRQLRVQAFGNVLHNTTTAMTLTVAINYGGTTIFSDATASYGATADADRQPWWLEFTITAQANNNQRMGGFFSAFGPTITNSTGIGDIGVDEVLANSPIGSATGGIAVDSDAGNRTLDIQFTMSAANALHDWVCQGITVELI